MSAPVIIAGGGPVGLSLGLGLAHLGVSSTILESRPEPAKESRALVIWPRTAELLADWKALDALRASGTWRSMLDIWSAQSGERLIEVDFSNVGDVLEYTGALLIPQDETERALRRLVRENRRCDLRTGCEVTSVAQDGEGVTVVARGASGEERFRGQYAVGCDGAHSVVRHALGLTLEGVTYRGRAVLSDEIVSPPLAFPSPRVSLSRPSFVLGIEYAPGRWRVVSLLPGSIADEAALEPTAHARRLEALFGRRMATQTIWSSLFHIHRRHAQYFVEGRVALAGDAAHLNSPAGGQGMNAGIQDAANLAWKLAYAVDGERNAPLLLSSYDLERREMITGGVERYTDALTRFGITGSRWFGAMPVRVIGRFLRAAGLQRKACRAVGMLGGRYTKSPLIDARHPLAGRRIDDLVLPGASRINRQRAGKAALVVIGDVDLTSAVGMTVIRLPTAPGHWHVKPPVVLIVRPDGVVAAVVEKPSRNRIDAALRKAFAHSG